MDVTSERESMRAVLGQLAVDTAASRITLRLDAERLGSHVDDPLLEWRGPDVVSLVGQTGLDQRSLKTVQWLEAERELLVQPDCLRADPPPPPALMELYGVRAQMLAPLIRDSVIGWISVHDTRSARDWTDEEVKSLRKAAEEVDSILASLGI